MSPHLPTLTLALLRLTSMAPKNSKMAFISLPRGPPWTLPPPILSPLTLAVRQRRPAPEKKKKSSPPSSSLTLVYPLASPLNPFPLSKVIFWNCRGITNPTSKRYLRRLITSHSSDILFLAEPPTSSPFNFLFLESFGFNCFFQRPKAPSTSHNHSPIWAFAKVSPSILINRHNSSPHHLTLSIYNSSTSSSFQITIVHAPCDIYLRRAFWTSLAALTLASYPWGIIGDFSAVLKPEERWNLAAFKET